MLRSSRAGILGCALLIPFVLAGCASSAKKTGGAVTRIVDSGVLRVGTTGEQPPLTMIARDGEFIGLDVALMRVLALNMGVSAKFVKLDFDQLLDALGAGEVDVVMSGMTITPKRVARVAFVGPYFTSGKSLLTRSKQLVGISDPAKLNQAELRIAALRGSTSEDFARASLPDVQLVLTAGLEEAVQKVVSGEVDALVADHETCSFAMLRFPEAGLMASDSRFTLEPMGIAVPLDQPQLANLIRVYFESLSETKGLAEAKDFWFKDPSWVKNLR